MFVGLFSSEPGLIKMAPPVAQLMPPSLQTYLAVISSPHHLDATVLTTGGSDLQVL